MTTAFDFIGWITMLGWVLMVWVATGRLAKRLATTRLKLILGFLLGWLTIDALTSHREDGEN